MGFCERDSLLSLSIDAVARIFVSIKKIENQSRARIKNDKILKMYNARPSIRKYADWQIVFSRVPVF